MSSPVNGDQILTALSLPIVSLREIGLRFSLRTYTPHEASSVPSGLNLTAEIEEVCPRMVCRSW